MKFNFIEYARKHAVILSKLAAAALIGTAIFVPTSMQVNAGSLTNVKDVLSNSRASFSTTITSTITTGDTTITLGSTVGFVQGDTITICNTGCTTTETKVIASVISTTQLGLTASAASTYTSGTVYLKSTSKHTIVITTRSAVSNGKFIVTMPANTGATTTLPSAAGFSFNLISTTTDISLAGGTAGTIATSTSGGNLVFTIPFTGTIAASANATITIGSSVLLLNPTKTAAQGTADTFQVRLDETDNSSNVIDTTTAQVGTIESVGVSATVTPSLTFSINAVASTTGSSVIGYNFNANSSATSVPFGNLTINATSTLAQYIHIDTNSNSGYNVTVVQDGSLRKSGGGTIVDFDSSTSQNNEAATGFGYSLNNKSGGGTDAAFLNTGSGSFNGRGFSSTTPFSIMSNSGPVNGSEVYVFYRVKVAATQAQGTYQNLVTYTATANY